MSKIGGNEKMTLSDIIWMEMEEITQDNEQLKKINHGVVKGGDAAQKGKKLKKFQNNA